MSDGGTQEERAKEVDGKHDSNPDSPPDAEEVTPRDLANELEALGQLVLSFS